MTNRKLLLLVCLFTWGSIGLAEDAPEDLQKYAELGECQLTSGESIAPCRVGYRTFGELNADRSNAILVPTWYTGKSVDHEFLVSPGLIDIDQYFVVIVDALGNGVSSSPSNRESQANERFPKISIADMVDSQHRLLTEVLEIQSLHGTVGLSMGGMQAFEWSVRYPDFSAKTVAVIGTPRLQSFDIGLWTGRNRLLALYLACECIEALEALEAFGMTALVPEKLEQEVSRSDAQSAITTRAKARSENISASKVWGEIRQAEAMIGHNIARDYDDNLATAAAQAKSDMMIIVGADDRIVTPEPAIEFAAHADAQLIVMDEDCGHGDPWCAIDEFSTLLRGFLSGPQRMPEER